MKKDQIQALNYSAHAIEDLKFVANKMRRIAPESANTLLRLVDKLQTAVKFILPNCGQLLDIKEVRQANLDLIRLPFPSVAFEAPWIKEDEGPEWIGDYKQTLAPKRIALCWETSEHDDVVPGLNKILDSFPEGGVFITSLYWDHAAQIWAVTMGGSFIPYNNSVTDMTLGDSLESTRFAYSKELETLGEQESFKQFRAEPFVLLPEVFQEAIANYGSREKAFGQIILDSRDEVMMVMQACNVINCANVTTADVHASPALNKKRLQNGKQPFFSYKVLQLSEERRGDSGTATGNNHNSPRMHLRRGHLRRLESKVVWVRPAVINAGSNDGVVVKDYAVVA